MKYLSATREALEIGISGVLDLSKGNTSPWTAAALGMLVLGFIMAILAPVLAPLSAAVGLFNLITRRVCGKELWK